MSTTIIAVNQTGTDIELVQLNVVVPGSGQVTLTDTAFISEIFDDLQLDMEITAGDILLNVDAVLLTQTESLNYLNPTGSQSTGTPANANKYVRLDAAGLLEGRDIAVDGTKLDTLSPGTLDSPAGFYTVAVSVVVGDVVYQSGVDQAAVADNANIATMPVLGIVIDKPTATTATVRYRGEVPLYVGLTPGKQFMASTGAFAPAPPSTVGFFMHQVGTAINTTTLVLNPGEVIGL